MGPSRPSAQPGPAGDRPANDGAGTPARQLGWDVATARPRWWNRQTRRTQNPVLSRGCGFDSRPGHQPPPPTGSSSPGDIVRLRTILLGLLVGLAVAVVAYRRRAVARHEDEFTQRYS